MLEEEVKVEPTGEWHTTAKASAPVGHDASPGKEIEKEKEESPTAYRSGRKHQQTSRRPEGALTHRRLSHKELAHPAEESGWGARLPQ